MSKQEIHIDEIKAKKHPCDLCGKGELGNENLYVGGYVTYAHEECCEIGDEAIARFFQLIAHHPNGTNILAEKLLKARGAEFDLNDLFKEPKANSRKSAPIDELWPDRKAFLEMKESLLANPKYAGKYVAVLGGKLIDSDDDQARLAKRVYSNYGYRQIYMSKVQRKEPVYRNEASGFVGNQPPERDKA